MYSNAVVDCHEDFDIVDFAQKFFATDKQLLIVREKGRKAARRTGTSRETSARRRLTSESCGSAMR